MQCLVPLTFLVCSCTELHLTSQWKWGHAIIHTQFIHSFNKGKVKSNYKTLVTTLSVLVLISHFSYLHKTWIWKIWQWIIRMTSFQFLYHCTNYVTIFCVVESQVIIIWLDSTHMIQFVKGWDNRKFFRQIWKTLRKPVKVFFLCNKNLLINQI